MIAAAAPNHRYVGVEERVMPHHVTLFGRQIEQGGVPEVFKSRVAERGEKQVLDQFTQAAQPLPPSKFLWDPGASTSF